LHLHFCKTGLFEASNIGTSESALQARRRQWRPQGRLPIHQSSQETEIMTEHSLWRFSRALHRAINDGQHADLEALIDEDIDWAIYGPIDMFPSSARATARPP
jgi:hypothetical protein